MATGGDCINLCSMLPRQAKAGATSSTNITLACSRRGGRRADDGCDDEDWRSGELVLRAVTVSLAAFSVGGDVAEGGSAVVTK